MIASIKPVPLHDLYRFRRSGDGAEVVYCCPDIHLTVDVRDIQERGVIVGCRHARDEDWLCWSGSAWHGADDRASRRFDKLPLLGDVPH